MTRKLVLPVLVALLMHSNSQAAIIVAGIDDWDNTTAPTIPVTAAGVTATASASASSGAWSISDSGTDPGRGSSDDTTWGSFDGNGVPANAVTNVGTANFTVTNGRPSAEVTLTVTNNGSLDVVLETFHMDALAFRPNAPRTYALNVLSGDITNGQCLHFRCADERQQHECNYSPRWGAQRPRSARRDRLGPHRTCG